MKSIGIAGLAFLAALGPATAGSKARDSFETGLGVCLNFGSDAWFVADRLEEAGWRGTFDSYYNATVYTSPDGSAWAIPPGDDGGFPAWCSVVSNAVGPKFAASAVRKALGRTNFGFSEYDNEGCYGARTALGQQILVFSDGQDDYCNDPNSARVNVIWGSDPAAGQ